MRCFFVSDLHGRVELYEKLLQAIGDEHPDCVLLGGDLLPFPYLQQAIDAADFVDGFLAARFETLSKQMGPLYPRVMMILGNDDPRVEEQAILEHQTRGIWEYVHDRRVDLGDFVLYGYAFVPPTPFRLKDWERYDVSRYTPHGSLSPEEGLRTVPVPEREIRHGNIQQDLEQLVVDDDLSRTIFLFHSPPHATKLDRADLDGKMVDHVPLDVHVGSIAIQRFIEKRQPRITLHGHIHESARRTGSWRDRIGRTHLFSAAHDGPELSLIEFDAEDPAGARRRLC